MCAARTLALSLATTAVISACGPSTDAFGSGLATASVTPRSTGLARPGCRPPSPIVASRSGPEVQGTSANGELWALLFIEPPVLHANPDVKIVWRMTGAGPLHLQAVGPRGQLGPVFGPEVHLGSTWNRPGDE